MKHLLLVLCLVLFVTLQASARTWYILPDSTGDAPTIQEGLNRAGYGDDVLVAPGTYYEHGIIMKNDVWLHSDCGAQTTIIDAQGQAYVIAGVGGNATIEGFTITGGAQSGIACYTYGGPCVIRDNVIRLNCNGIRCEEGTASHILNNTIRDNTAPGNGGAIFVAGGSSPTIEGNVISHNYAAGGGGIYCDYGSASNFPVIIGNTISDNSTTYNGGGIYLAGYSSVVVDSNNISGNSADIGGGIYCLECPPAVHITSNSIEQNIASKGAGIYCEAASPSIRENVISWNEATNWGGGIYCYSDSALVERNILAGNSSGLYGGALSFYSSYRGRVISNTVVSNSAPQGAGVSCQFGANAKVSNNIIVLSTQGAGMYCHSALPVLSCNDIWNNAGGDATCGTDAGHNFSHDPEFCNAASGDYSIDEMSPCAPGNSPSGCGLIGALPVGCASAGVPSKQTEGTTWGSIKSIYK